MSTPEEELVYCYNPGCPLPSKKFKPSENSATSCCFHPGAPVFHEGLKGWTCCKKRVTCFDEWLSMKGCTTGPCNPVKPEKEMEVAKSARERAAAESAAEAASRNVLKTTAESSGSNKNGDGSPAPGTPKQPEKYIKAPPTKEQLEVLKQLRPSVDSQKINLKVVTLGSHKREFDKGLKKLEEMKAQAKKEQDLLNDPESAAQQEIAEGTRCCRKGCKETYPSMTDCIYHPGVEVFHEGCKYWSCCQRVTSDFNSFLSQEGCHRTDEHLWIGPRKKTLRLRWDFFQVGDTVTLNFYAKSAVISTVVCQINAVSIYFETQFEAGGAKFRFSSELFDTLDLEHASNKVKVGGSKIEVTLRKKNLVTWGDFCPAGQKVEIKSEYITEDEEQPESSKADEKKLITANKNLKISDLTGSQTRYNNKKLKTVETKNNDAGEESSDLEDYL